MTFKKIIGKPTLISILASILLLFGIPLSIYYHITLEASASVLVLLIMLANFVIFIALLIDRIIVRKISQKKLSIYELVFLVLCITIYSYSERKTIVDIENENVEYLLVIENPGDLTNDKTHLKFPFNKRISTTNGIVIVDKMPKNLEFNINANWISYHYKEYEFEKYPKVTLYCKLGLDLIKNINQNFIDSLMNKEMTEPINSLAF